MTDLRVMAVFYRKRTGIERTDLSDHKNYRRAQEEILKLR